MPPDALPKGQGEWQEFLSDKPFPILKRTKQDVQALIDQPQLSITQYAGPVYFDSCFTASIFQRVNTQRIKAGRTGLTTLDNALSNLGQAAFQDFLNASTVFENLDLPERNKKGFMRCMGMACHASLQAKHWAIARQVLQTEEILLAALLQNIAELMLWCYGDDVMPQIEQACYVEKKTYHDAAQSILGCGVRELGASLAEKWNLPEMAQDGLLSRLDNFTLATGASFAAEIARLADLNWYGLEREALIEKIAKYMGKAEGEAERIMHLSAVQENQVLIGRGFRSPLRCMPMLADDKFVDPQFILESEEPAAQTAEVNPETKLEQAAPVKNKQVNNEKDAKSRASAIAEKLKAKNPELKNKIAGVDLEALKARAAAIKKVKEEGGKQTAAKPVFSEDFAKAVKQLKQMVADAKPAHELIEFTVQSIPLCGVDRCVFSVRVPAKKILVTRYQSQVEDAQEIQSLKIPLDKPHVFTLLMEKPRSVFINDSNRQKYWGLIPDTVKLKLNVKSFLSMSIFSGKHAMGLMYADKPKGELTAVEFKQFQLICGVLSKGIAQASHNKHKE